MFKDVMITIMPNSTIVNIILSTERNADEDNYETIDEAKSNLSEGRLVHLSDDGKHFSEVSMKVFKSHYEALEYANKNSLGARTVINDFSKKDNN